MGYSIESKRIKVFLDNKQQELAFKLLKEEIYSEIPDCPKNMNIHSEEFFKYHRTISFHGIAKFLKDLEKNKKEVKFLDYLLEIYPSLDYQESTKGVKLLSIHTKLKDYQQKFWEIISPIMTPGNYIVFKGEENEIFGFFFNNKCINFDSYKELALLKETIKPIKLAKALEKELVEKNKAKSPKI